MGIETTFGKMSKMSAKNIKRSMNEYKKAAEESGMADMFGRNGPIGRYGFDIAMPGASEGLFDQLSQDSSETGKQLRQVFKYAFGKSAGEGKTTTARLGDVNKYLGRKDGRESFASLARSVKDWDGKGDMYQKVIEGAQNVSQLSSQLAQTNVQGKATRAQRNAGEALGVSPASTEAKATADLAKNTGRTTSLAELAASKRRQENEDG